MKSGILALQGDFALHKKVLDRLGYENRYIRQPSDLESIDSLILPGGESSAIRILLQLSGLLKPLQELIKSGLPVFGTCAGAILLCSGKEERKGNLADLPVLLERNGYGSQISSFSEEISGCDLLSTRKFPGTFIRAPRIKGFDANTIKILGELKNHEPVLIQQGKILCATFHPEFEKGCDFLFKYFLRGGVD